MEDLPPELIWDIMVKIDDENITNYCGVNKVSRDICKNPIFWADRLRYHHPDFPVTSRITSFQQYMKRIEPSLQIVACWGNKNAEMSLENLLYYGKCNAPNQLDRRYDYNDNQMVWLYCFENREYVNPIFLWNEYRLLVVESIYLHGDSPISWERAHNDRIIGYHNSNITLDDDLTVRWQSPLEILLKRCCNMPEIIKNGLWNLVMDFQRRHSID